MRAHVPTTAVFVLILCLAAGPARGQQQGVSHTIVDPGLPPAVEIESMEVVGQPIVGNTFEVRVRYTSHVDVAGKLAIRAPKTITLTAAPAGRRLMSQSRAFRKDQTQTKTFTLRAEKSATSIVHVGFTVPDAPPGYRKSTSRYLYLQNTKTSFDVFDPRKEQQPPAGIRKQLLADQKTTRGALPAGMQVQNTMNYTVSVSGKVQFDSGFPDELQGVYGVKVKFWFYDEDTDTYYHPLQGNDRHVHYDDVDAAGNYSFDFTFTGDVSEFEKIALYVPFTNEATHTRPYISQTLFYTFNSNDPSITLSKDPTILPNYGAVLRRMMLSREFAFERYNGNPSFGDIKTYVEDIDDAAGKFRCDENWLTGDENYWIKIDPDNTDFSTVSHEFGHWEHYNLFDSGDCSTWEDASDQTQEGWAIFYSFATRNYATANYGDALLAYDDNTEEDPFVTASSDEDGDPYRFAGIDYAYFNHPDYAAFGSYLWALYDSYGNATFEASSYDDGDNEDLSRPVQVFDVMNEHQPTSAGGYNSTFKDQGVSGSKGPSVQEIYHFMTSDYVNVPDEPMRPAQPSNLSGTISGTEVNLSWSPQRYSSDCFYCNYPQEYRIKKGGSLVATRSPSASSASFNETPPNGFYKVAAQNASGTGADVPSTRLGMTASISGPQSLDSGELGTWTASATNPPGSVSYQWSDSQGGSGSGSSYTSAFNVEYTTTETISVTATSGAQEADGVYVVTVQPSECEERICIQSADSTIASADSAGALKKAGTAGTVLPDEFSLEGNAPNPFSSRTQIRFALPKAVYVQLVVYDMLGREVARVLSRKMEAGVHHAPVEASDLSNGMYLYRMRAGEQFTDTGKLVVVK